MHGSPDFHLTTSPTWWFWRGGCTRSHSELGRETPQRRWYFVLRRGRVGRCQVCKVVSKTSGAASARCPLFDMDFKTPLWFARAAFLFFDLDLLVPHRRNGQSPHSAGACAGCRRLHLRNDFSAIAFNSGGEWPATACGARFAPQFQGIMMDAKSFLIGALLVAVGVLGYLYYEDQQTTVKIDVPGVKIEGN